jgi:predicted membrane protein
MFFIISFALSLLTLTAGLFLLIRSKQDLGKFFRIMAWIITSCGILAVLMSVHFAIFRCVMHKHDKFSKEKHEMFFRGKGFMNKCDKFEEFSGNKCDVDKDDDEDMKVIVKKEMCDVKCDPETQSTAVMKIITDNVKLTADQEKNIKSALVLSFKSCCSKDKDKSCYTKDKDKDEVKETK